MNYLIASILSLAVGPLLYYAFRQQYHLLTAISTFVVISLFGMVIFEILPQLWASGGAAVLPAILLGFLGPSLAEKAFQQHSRFTHNLTMLLGVFGLLLHTLSDGSAIFLVNTEQANEMLALGIVLHNLPAGLAIWWLLLPSFGRKVATATLLTLMLFTALGFWLGEAFLSMLSLSHSVYLQAFVTGSILHVLVHRPHEHHDQQHQHSPLRYWRPNQGHYLGTALAIVFLMLLVLSHHDHSHPGHGVAELDRHDSHAHQRLQPENSSLHSQHHLPHDEHEH